MKVTIDSPFLSDLKVSYAGNSAQNEDSSKSDFNCFHGGKPIIDDNRGFQCSTPDFLSQVSSKPISKKIQSQKMACSQNVENIDDLSQKIVFSQTSFGEQITPFEENKNFENQPDDLLTKSDKNAENMEINETPL